MTTAKFAGTEQVRFDLDSGDALILPWPLPDPLPPLRADQAAEIAAWVSAEGVPAGSPLESAKATAAATVERARDARIAAGVEVTIAAATFVVQTRHETDFRNINGLATAALALSGQGVTGPVIGFRDAGDVVRQLTPAQMLELGLAIQQAGGTAYAWSWGHKNALDALDPETATPADAEAIEAAAIAETDSALGGDAWRNGS